MDLTFTVPFPCGYYSNAVHINKINKDTCPLHIELAVPVGSGGRCESRLVGDGNCGIKIYPEEWNKTHVMKVIHKDTLKYDLTTAEAEMKLYLKTYKFKISKLWREVLLPVVNVINTVFFAIL